MKVFMIERTMRRTELSNEVTVPSCLVRFVSLAVALTESIRQPHFFYLLNIYLVSRIGKTNFCNVLIYTCIQIHLFYRSLMSTTVY